MGIIVMKDNLIALCAGVMVVFSFVVSWFNVVDGKPIAILLMQNGYGEDGWLGFLAVLPAVGALILLLLKQRRWLFILGLAGVIPFGYLLDRMIRAGFQLQAEGNMFAQNDAFFGLRFFSLGFWVHLVVSVVFLGLCLWASFEANAVEEEDEEDGETGDIEVVA